LSSTLKLVDNDPDDLIPLAKGADMLGLDPSTIRQRKAGTSALSIIPQGRKLFLIRGEVVAHRQKLIDNARRRTNVLELVK
jgi:hypothetical protein